MILACILSHRFFVSLFHHKPFRSWWNGRTKKRFLYVSRFVHVCMTLERTGYPLHNVQCTHLRISCPPFWESKSRTNKMHKNSRNSRPALFGGAFPLWKGSRYKLIDPLHNTKCYQVSWGHAKFKRTDNSHCQMICFLFGLGDGASWYCDVIWKRSL